MYKNKKVIIIGTIIFLFVFLFATVLIFFQNKPNYLETKEVLKSQMRTVNSLDNSEEKNRGDEILKVTLQMKNDMDKINCKRVDSSYESECERLKTLISSFYENTKEGKESGILFNNKLPDTPKEKELLFGWVEKQKDLNSLLEIK